MLYLVATPIGNLADLSPRAIETLQQCEEIFCEDTRHTSHLTKQFSISTPLRSYHKFNEAKQLEAILTKLEGGADLALVSDAGTPAIHDPGERLVAACAERGIPMSAIPGPCALLQALLLSGLPTTPFQFLGFVPRKEGERRRFLASLLCYSGTTVLYESPKRVTDTLAALATMAPERPCCLARELTKKFEEYLRGTAAELYALIEERTEIRGECALVIGGQPQDERWSDLSPLALVKHLQENFSLSEKEALKLAAELIGLSKRELYQQLLQSKETC